MTRDAFRSCSCYIRKIKNANKRAYAESYWAWRCGGSFGNPPERICGAMAAQATRMAIDGRIAAENAAYGAESPIED